MKVHSFSATPTPADEVTPRVFTIATIIKNDRPTRKSCRAIGEPILKMCLLISLDAYTKPFIESLLKELNKLK